MIKDALIKKLRAGLDYGEKALGNMKDSALGPIDDANSNLGALLRAKAPALTSGAAAADVGYNAGMAPFRALGSAIETAHEDQGPEDRILASMMGSVIGGTEPIAPANQVLQGITPHLQGLSSKLSPKDYSDFIARLVKATVR